MMLPNQTGSVFLPALITPGQITAAVAGVPAATARSVPGSAGATIYVGRDPASIVTAQLG